VGRYLDLSLPSDPNLHGEAGHKCSG
jgi:hypothetical protein